MKIVEIIPALASGGAERFVVDLCNEVSKTNDVTLVVLHKIEGEKAFYVNQLSNRVKVISLGKRYGVDFYMLWRVYKCTRDIRPDIVHTHVRAIVYSLLLVFTNVHWFHTIHSEASKEAGGFVSRAVRQILFRTKRTIPITISSESYRSFVAFYGMDTFQINNGRDIPETIVISDSVKQEFERYRKNCKTRVIVQLAHISKVKRPDLLARVAHRLYDEGYDFSILFIGRETPYVEKVKKVMPDNCFLLGEKENPLEYLCEAGAYCLCSDYEGLPMSLIEALGVGAIPICTPVGGISDVIRSGVNGILSDSILEESFYHAVKKYLEMTDDEITVMSEKAKESYSLYSMKECAARYVDLFNYILGQMSF